MTAISQSNVPWTSIDTLEKLNAWTGLALTYLNPSLQAVEGVGINEYVSQAGIFYVKADNKFRLLNRQSLQVSADYLGGGKLWQYVQPLTNTAIPSLFTT